MTVKEKDIEVTDAKLRDMIATHCLAAIGTWIPDDRIVKLDSQAALQARAKWAYRQADAMLAARKEKRK